eukprot:1141279-Pelagomonas_calceolata.AAC.1
MSFLVSLTQSKPFRWKECQGTTPGTTPLRTKESRGVNRQHSVPGTATPPASKALGRGRQLLLEQRHIPCEG